MNEIIFLKLNSFIGQSLWLDVAAIIISKKLSYILIGGLLIFAHRSKDLKNLLVVPLAAALISKLFVEIIRFFYSYPRPFVTLPQTPTLFPHDPSGSFPSSHVTFFFALGTAVYLKNKKAGILICISAIIIGLARVYSGVHWPLDVLGGAVLGILTGLLISKILKHV